jgi:hypothetical protein
MTIASVSCSASEEIGYTRNAWLAMIIFSLLGAIFLLTGGVMIYKTKHYFKLFYNEYKCQLWFATIFLSLPLFFRALLIGLMRRNYSVKVWFDGHYAGANNTCILLDTFLPILSQVVVLIFGFARGRDDKSIVKMNT